MSQNALKRVRSAVPFALTFGTCLSACAGLPGLGSTSWKEEALLHDGRKIIVSRTVERGGRHEIGQQPPIKEQSIRFTLPGTNELVTWEDAFSQDIGGAAFLPMTLGISDGIAYLVVKPMGCLSYNKWGRPNPPYVIFKYQNSRWSNINIQGLPIDIKTPNLISSSPDDFAKKSRESIISSETIKAFTAEYKQPESKTILREPMARERCPQYSSSPKAPIQVKPSIPAQ